MKRVLALLMTMVLLLLAVGCAGSGAKGDGETTITWLIPGDKPADLEAVLEEANKITVEKIGAKLDMQYIDLGAYSERMTMNFASGSDAFDLCFTGYVNPYKDAVVKGAYKELDKYVEKSDVIKEQIPEYARNAAMVDGELYGLPNMQVLASGVGLFINKKLADEAGLDVSTIKSLEDIEPFLKWVKEHYPNMYPFRHGRYGGGCSDSIMKEDISSGVAAVFNEDGSYTVQTPEELGYFTEQDLMRSWFEKGYIRADVASCTDDTNEYTAGRYAVWRSAYKPGAEIEIKNANPVNECYCVLISEPYLQATAGSSSMTAINAKSKNPELAFKMYELMHSDKELYNLICYGIQGKHYELNENNKVVKIEDSGYNPNASWKFGNVFNSYLLDGQEDGTWEKTTEYNNQAMASPLAGFTFDQSAVRTQIAQVATVTSKYKQGDTGAEPASAWRDDYFKELKAAGIDDIKAEVEKQLKEWEENK